MFKDNMKPISLDSEKVKDNWNKEFAKADVKVDVDFVLRRSGIRSKSFLTETEK